MSMSADDPALMAAQNELGKLIISRFLGAPITREVLKEIDGLIKEYRGHKRIQGVKLPRLALLALPQTGYIQVWPADLDDGELRKRLRMLIKGLQDQGKDPSPDELAKALKRAYPGYSPSTSKLIH